VCFAVSKQLIEDDFEGSLGSGESDVDDTSLCNALVLCGPHGVGKTSMVYAVAKELGFKVSYRTIITSSINAVLTSKRNVLVVVCWVQWLGGVVVGSRTCDWQIVGSIPGCGIVGQRPWASCSHQCASVYQAL